jgi:hypothetical protein
MAVKTAPHNPEEMRLLYEVTVNDLTYFKTQQWSVTNYVFLLLAAVAYLHQQLIGDLSSIELYALALLVILVAVAGLIVLSKLQHSVRVRQSRPEATREFFSLSFRQAWAAETKGPEYFHSHWFLRAAVVLGALIDLWLVFR